VWLGYSPVACAAVSRGSIICTGFLLGNAGRCPCSYGIQLPARDEFGGRLLDLLDAGIGAQSFSNGEDSDGRMPLFHDVPQHAEVRIVRHAGLSDRPSSRSESALRPVDGLALGEVELVKGAPAAHASFTAELDPFRV